MNLYGPPTCSYLRFEQHLEHSPAHAEAGDIWRVLTDAKIDPALGLGFFHHESACGTQGRAVTTKSWGNLRWKVIDGAEPYASLSYAVRDVDGFCAYPSYAIAARHFCDHLLGRDGTSFYRGLSTVEEIVPKWAPSADGNAPAAYISALLTFAQSLSGGNMAKPRILLVAGHNNIESITVARLPSVPTAQSVADRLRTGTGSRGEREWTGSFVQLACDALNASGQVAATFTDAVWHEDVYAGQHYDLVVACHYHRDADRERAMFATVDPDLKGVIAPEARAEAQRFVDRLVGGYEQATGIPVTQPLVTLNMTQLYSYDYPEADCPMLCAEFGNANLDAPVLYEPGIARIVRYFRDCVLEHLNLAGVAAPQPQRRATDQQPPAAPPARTKAVVLAEIRARLDELQAL